jgi:hypothetical protein
VTNDEIELSQAVSPGAHAVVLMDRAGWHIAKDLAVPANLTPLFLPPYSPELNAIERVRRQPLRARSGRPEQDDSPETPRPCELAHSWVAAAAAIVIRSVPAATHRRERGGPASGAARPAPWTLNA